MDKFNIEVDGMEEAPVVNEDTGEASEFENFLKVIAEDAKAVDYSTANGYTVEDGVPEGSDEDEDEPLPKDEDDSEEDDDEENTDEDDSDEDEGDESDEEDEQDEDEELENSDPVEVDFDTVITLPNGEEVSIEELSNGYKSTGELTEAQKEFEEQKRVFEEDSKDLAEKLDLAQLEAQRVLDDFKDFDWQKLAQEDPQEFANTKLFVEKYANRKVEIQKAKAQIEEQVENEKAVELENKARECVKVLERDLPEWNQDLYQKVIQHAIELGMPQEEALNLTDAGVIKALVNSMSVEKGRRVVKAKITKKVKAPTKVVKSGGKKPTKATKAPKADYNSEAEEFAFFSKFL